MARKQRRYPPEFRREIVGLVRSGRSPEALAREFEPSARVEMVTVPFSHGIESLYATYEPRHASQLAERLEIHYTPTHGSWLNIAEIELSTLCGQCLDRRIPSLAQMQREIKAWVVDRNQRQTEINWQFTTVDARIKLKSLYPKL